MFPFRFLSDTPEWCQVLSYCLLTLPNSADILYYSSHDKIHTDVELDWRLSLRVPSPRTTLVVRDCLLPIPRLSPYPVCVPISCLSVQWRVCVPGCLYRTTGVDMPHRQKCQNSLLSRPNESLDIARGVWLRPMHLWLYGMLRYHL